MVPRHTMDDAARRAIRRRVVAEYTQHCAQTAQSVENASTVVVTDRRLGDCGAGAATHFSGLANVPSGTTTPPIIHTGETDGHTAVAPGPEPESELEARVDAAPRQVGIEGRGQGEVEAVHHVVHHHHHHHHHHQHQHQRHHPRWVCCDVGFEHLSEIQRHIVAHHTHCVEAGSQSAYAMLVQCAASAGVKVSAGSAKGRHVIQWACRPDAACTSCGWAGELQVTPARQVAGSGSSTRLLHGGTSARRGDSDRDSGELAPILVGRHHRRPLRAGTALHAAEAAAPRLADAAAAPPMARADGASEGVVLLWYHYCAVEDPADLARWFRAECTHLGLVGKVRVAREGLNGTVSGTSRATTALIRRLLLLPPFSIEMTPTDFKRSAGPIASFPDLQVSIVNEIITLGIDPRELPQARAVGHLAPAEFHALAASGDPDVLVLDVRNFFEHRVGRFTGAIAPDLRKFSYFPGYFDANVELFRGKQVLMYCTGGIRCERASVYLDRLGVCDSIFQLDGGVHRYLERFPDGLFRGKLYVFDSRQTIATNEDVISVCFYCDTPHDTYTHCSTEHCRILVLICGACRGRGITACCGECGLQTPDVSQEAQMTSKQKPNPPCLCVRSRSCCPIEVCAAGMSIPSPTMTDPQLGER